MRDAFVAKKGSVILSADYSQIELRVLAHLSRDEGLLSAFRDDVDVHIRTAATLFDIPETEVSRHEREQAKTVNYAVIYGQTEFALARNLGISRADAKQYISAFFSGYAGVRAFMDRQVDEAKSTGYVTTLSGRRRALNDIRSRNFHLRSGAERMARNTPIQGTAADIIKVAMINIDRQLGLHAYRAQMLLTVHDELVFEVPRKELKGCFGIG